MCEAIDCLRQEIDPMLAKNVDPVLGRATMSVGIIQGGSKVNIVPDVCQASVDIRTIPGMNTEFVSRMLKDRVPDIQIEMLGSEPLFTDPAHPLIHRLQSLGASLAGAPWFCDAAVFAAKGCPSIAIGPGSIAQAHTADEFISMADLEDGGRFFLNFLKSLASP